MLRSLQEMARCELLNHQFMNSVYLSKITFELKEAMEFSNLLRLLELFSLIAEGLEI